MTTRRYESQQRAASAAETRTRILDAGQALFVENGYSPTTMQHIADSAGVSVQSVHLAGSKASLMTAILHRAFTGDEDFISLLERPEFAAIMHDDAVQPPGWWDEVGSSGRPIIHVTQGTLDNHDFTQLVVPTLEAMKSLDVHVVVSTGGAPIDTITSPVPSNAVVAEHIDYRWLLPRTSVLVTNGGYGTVQQALAHGVPVVVAPGGEDKPEVAARVGYFRTGVDLGTRRPTPGQIRDAIQTATTDSVIRDNVRAFAVSARSYDPIAVVTEAAQLILGTPGEADTDEMERTS